MNVSLSQRVTIHDMCFEEGNYLVEEKAVSDWNDLT